MEHFSLRSLIDIQEFNKINHKYYTRKLKKELETYIHENE